MILAAVEIDNNQLMVAIIGAIGILIGLYSKARALEKSIRTGDKVELKQPVDVMLAAKPFTRDDHNAVCGPLHQRVGVLENDVRAIRSTMARDKSEIIDAGETRMRKIHERVDTVLHAVARVEGAIEQMRADHR
ncbi:MAG: hypothetical protein WCO94_05805 [Verrucomicrobiota bacterium]